jgi:branched-chain amino acid transport system ATP-binding protein
MTAPPAPSPPPLLSVRGLVRRYGRLVALDRLDLDLAAGARHAVIGPNGAGKTTLLHLVAGTVRPTHGRVRLAGLDVTTMSPARRARLGIARTFQTPAVCPSLSALDNVVLGAWRHMPGRGPGAWWGGRYRLLAARGLRLLDRLGIGHLAGQPAGALPHGQQRLLELGVALAARPRLLLLDEPAAGLAPEDLPLLVACLRRLPADVTVLLVEHHLDLVTSVAGTVTVLHHGRVLATGTPRQVTRDPAVAEVYLGDVHLDRADLHRGGVA